MEVRPADATEIDSLARLWRDGWRDAHQEILPAELKQLRTLESFRDRLAAGLPTVRVVGPRGSPIGLCMVRDDELYQLYVSAEARGCGVAAVLIADAESRMAAAGVKTAWLACAVGNHRAARFYEKSAWHRAGTVVIHTETTNGDFPLEVWRYEKLLASQS